MAQGMGTCQGRTCHCTDPAWGPRQNVSGFTPELTSLLLWGQDSGSEHLL